MKHDICRQTQRAQHCTLGRLSCPPSAPNHPHTGCTLLQRQHSLSRIQRMRSDLHSAFCLLRTASKHHKGQCCVAGKPHTLYVHRWDASLHHSRGRSLLPTPPDLNHTVGTIFCSLPAPSHPHTDCTRHRRQRNLAHNQCMHSEVRSDACPLCTANTRRKPQRYAQHMLCTTFERY